MARKRQETLVLFKDVLNITEKFSDAQFGALMRAAFDYRFEGEGYQGEDALVELAFRMLEAQIDRYREACETNTKKCTAGRTDASCGAGSTGNHSAGSAGGVLRKRGGAKCSGIQRNAAECPS